MNANLLGVSDETLTTCQNRKLQPEKETTYGIAVRSKGGRVAGVAGLVWSVRESVAGAWVVEIVSRVPHLLWRWGAVGYLRT